MRRKGYTRKTKYQDEKGRFEEDEEMAAGVFGDNIVVGQVRR